MRPSIIQLRRTSLIFLVTFVLISIWTYAVLLASIWAMEASGLPDTGEMGSLLGVAGYVWLVAALAVLGISTGFIPATKLSRWIIGEQNAASR